MNGTTAPAAYVTPITSTADPRYNQYVGEGYTGYTPAKVGTYVYIHAARDYVQRGLLLDVLHGNYRTPTLYQVIEIQPGYDIEVIGGIAHQDTLYVCRDTTASSGDQTLTVPAIRLVPAETPATAT
jgi:hypothetical protein